MVADELAVNRSAVYWRDATASFFSFEGFAMVVRNENRIEEQEEDEDEGGDEKYSGRNQGSFVGKRNGALEGTKAERIEWASHFTAAQ
ncbi:hypothetical protein Nepgr_017315 [Nepenthes gracilis]|uniref:Uncharacterized protein n=1 Tax=Nepenthes gracilis TaxID=150966 RepID=A0AAD3SRF0_NEPGR|nr:hypothetical protein Nepgr_017315 [Nepenthes gracilis]